MLASKPFNSETKRYLDDRFVFFRCVIFVRVVAVKCGVDFEREEGFAAKWVTFFFLFPEKKSDGGERWEG